jgi:hypothetical protein
MRLSWGNIGTLRRCQRGPAGRYEHIDHTEAIVPNSPCSPLDHGNTCESAGHEAHNLRGSP